MQMALFLVWSFAYWPVIGVMEYVFVKWLGLKSFLLGGDFFTFVVVVIWIVGMVQSFKVYRITQGVRHADDDKEDEPDANTMLIVEAPNHQQAEAVGAEYIESEVCFDTVPVKGNRLVLNAEDDDDSNILGTVDEVAEVAHRFNDEKKYRAWVKLDKPEDYTELYSSISWSSGLGEKRRSTAPVIDPAARQAPT